MGPEERQSFPCQPSEASVATDAVASAGAEQPGRLITKCTGNRSQGWLGSFAEAGRWPYSSSLYYWLLRILALASLIAICLALVGVKRQETLRSEGLLAQSGFMFAVRLQSGLPFMRVVGDTNDSPFLSQTQLFEDGNSLGPEHSLHTEIISKGAGRYSNYHDYLYFSSRDNSDPRINGRTYRVTYRVYLVPWLAAAPTLLALMMLFVGPASAPALASSSIRRRVETLLFGLPLPALLMAMLTATVLILLSLLVASPHAQHLLGRILTTPEIFALAVCCAVVGVFLSSIVQDSRHERVVSLVITTALVFAYCVLIAVASRQYADDYESTVLNNTVFARDLQSGALPTWIPELVLGVPAPLAHSQIFHPLEILFFFTDPHLALTLFYVAHAIIGATFIYLLMRELSVSHIVLPFGVFAFLFSPASIRSTFESDWITLYIIYTLFPALLFLLFRLIHSKNGNLIWYSIGVGYVAGIMGSSGHLGHFICFVPAILLLLVVYANIVLNRLKFFLVAGLIAIGMSIGQIGPVFYNAALFGDPGTRYFNSIDNRHCGQLFALLVGTFDFRVLGEAQLHQSLWKNAFSPWWYTSFGGAFIILGFLESPFRTRVTAYLVFATLASLLLMLVRESYFGGLVSASWVFGDAATVTGILLGSMAATRLLETGHKRIVVWALTFQTFFLALAPTQLIGSNLRALFANPSDRPGFFVDLESMPEFLKAIQQPAQGRLTRLYYGPAFERRVNVDQGMLRDSMLNNTPVFYGMGNLTAYAKGVWLGDVYPPLRPMHNWIYPDQENLEGGEFLNVLSVKYVIILDGERHSPKLHEVARSPTHLGGDVVVLENPNAWPDGVFLRPEAKRATVPNVAFCEYNTIYCMDFDEIASFRIANSGAEVRRIGGSFDVKFQAADRERVLMIPDLFRPGWTAFSDVGRLTIYPLFRGLIGLDVPAGVTNIRMYYLPKLSLAGMVVSLLCSSIISFIFLYAGTAALIRRLRKEAAAYKVKLRAPDYRHCC
jgi:hypothetical protein